MKTIKFYSKSIYGKTHEFIHPDCVGADFDIRQLTNQKTINPLIRNTISRLTDNFIQFEEVLPPK